MRGNPLRMWTIQEYDNEYSKLEADNKALREALDSIAYGNVLTGNGKRCHTWSFGDIRERAKQALKGESK